MKQFYLIMSIVFTIFTIVSIFFVFTNDAQFNAGYCVIPMLITLSFSSAYRKIQKCDTKAENENQYSEVQNNIQD